MDIQMRIGSKGVYGGVHIGPWKETDILSGDQKVIYS